ncbi:MAG TPA: DUF4058 family protein [Tepidisphaeraceae bacterium]|nr:DUF4058 family protein [Tepidisphaeraceae bacterium]
MPAHDWTRISAGTFHSFHLGWIAELTRALNGGLLPEDYYALAEQRTGEFEPDVLALERRSGDEDVAQNTGGGLALAVAPPKAHVMGEVDEASIYAIKRRTVAIRHATNDRIVALLEIASPGNKDRSMSVRRFTDKAVAAIQSGYHMVVVDLFPPRANDPAGLGSAIWEELGGGRLQWPAGKRLSASSFRVADRVQCYAEPFAPGDSLPEMPLFYDPDWYVNLPLATTYAAAYEGVPRQWRRVLDLPATPDVMLQ